MLLELLNCTSSFCHLDIVKEFPRFGHKISAKMGSSRQSLAKTSLKPAKIQLKIDKTSTKSQLSSTKWGLFISHLRWWERKPKLQSTNCSGELLIDYGLSLQSGPCPEVIDATVTALGLGSPGGTARERMNHSEAPE